MPIRIEDYTFDGPFARVEDLKERAGVYAVVCLMSNQRHFLIDVGESDNIRNTIRFDFDKMKRQSTRWISRIRRVTHWFLD